MTNIHRAAERSSTAEGDEIPEWKAAFLAKPSISIRKGISFDYDQPKEKSSVLVLTSTAGKFVDIRFPKVLKYHDNGQRELLISHPSFWAFSGISETTFYDEQSGPRPSFPFVAHTVFKHDIDSKGTLVNKGPGGEFEDIVDQGDCFILPNGDVMEIGLWYENGKIYKELWSAPELLPNRESILMRPVVVLETTFLPHGSGRIIRIGDYIQGIYRTFHSQGQQSGIIVERLYRDTGSRLRRYDDRDDVSDVDHIDGWIMDERSNARNGTLQPFTELRLTGDLRNISLGAELESGGTSWRVTEYEP